nr:PREDICTED: uncharacterized protein KIAA1211-like homolog isoform X3 [Lepisosteus oculatus]
MRCRQGLKCLLCDRASLCGQGEGWETNHRAPGDGHNHTVAAKLMDSKTGESEGSSEDVSGKKKSKFKTFKMRLFGKRKRKEDGKSGLKLSQSSSDITAPESMRAVYDSEEESGYSLGLLASRALSHDSIFIPEASQVPPAPSRVSSQENVHGRIKALQLKLQQNIRLGPPPLVTPSRRAEDTGASSEDDGLPRSPPEISSVHEGLARFTDTYRHLSSLSLAGTGSEEEEQSSSQPSSRPLSPVSKPSSRPTSPQSPDAPVSSPSTDFASPPQSTACLDSSAARHRLSVKPRKQRASARGRRPAATAHRSRSESLNDLESTLLEKEEEEEHEAARVPQEIVRCHSYSSQVTGTESRTAAQLIQRPTLVQAQDTPEDQPSKESHRKEARESRLRPAGFCEPVDHNFTNPLSSQPVPGFQDYSAIQESLPVADSAAEETLCKQGPAEVKNPSTSKAQSQDLVKEILNSGPYSPKGTILSPGLHTSDHAAPTALVSATSLTNNNGSLNRSSQNFIQGVHVDNNAKELPSPPPRMTKSLVSVDRAKTPKTSSLKKNTATVEGVSLSPQPGAQRTAPPSAKGEHLIIQTPDAGCSDPRHRPSFKKTSAGSFRFSVSSAWDRPRAGSFTGVESSEVKTEDVPLAKTSSFPKLHPVSRVEEIKSEPQGGLGGSQRERRNTWIKPEPEAPRAAKEQLGTTAPPAKREDGAAGGAGGREEDQGGRSTFGVKLRATSLSLKYRQDFKSELAMKRRSAEAYPVSPSTQEFILPSKEGKSDPEKTWESACAYLRDGSKPMAKSSSEQPHVKPPLPRKPAAQSTAAPVSSNTPKDENKELDRPSHSKVNEKAAPLKTVAEKEAVAVSGPMWISMARQRQRGVQLQYSSKEDRDTAAEIRTDNLTPGEHKPEEGRARREVCVTAESPSLRRDGPDSRPDVRAERRQPGKTAPSEVAPCAVPQAEREVKLPSTKDTLLPVSGGGQPSWMELAKKKAQAWSDKTVD